MPVIFSWEAEAEAPPEKWSQEQRRQAPCFSPVLKDVEGQEYEESIDLVAEFAIHSAVHESVR